MNAANYAAWEQALTGYSYPVDLRNFSGAATFQPRFFSESINGDWISTKAFGARFRRLAPDHIEAWAEVVFWKMYSQGVAAAGGRASYRARKILEKGADPRVLWDLCLAYVNDPTRQSLDRFKSKLFSSPAIATASALAAFADEQGRLPIVDTWIARWVEANRAVYGNANCPRLLKPPPGTPQLYHFDFVKSWIDWCACMAKDLSSYPESSLQWSALDVEMAIFQAARTSTLLPVCWPVPGSHPVGSECPGDKSA